MDFKKLQKAALAAGIKEIEVYAVKNNGIEISAFNGEIEKNTAYNTDVLAIRGVYNNQIVTIYEENNSDDVIPSVIEKIKDNCSVMNKVDPFFIYGGDKDYPKLPDQECDFDSYTLEDKANLCLKAAKMLKAANKYVTKTEVGYEETETSVVLQNSNGLDVKRHSRSAFFVVEVVVEKDGETKTGFDYCRLGSISELKLEELVETTINDAVGSLGAESIPSGSYSVVLDKKVVSSILGAFSNIYSADSVLKNMSFLKDKIGEKVFGDNITLIDDPLCLDAPSQYPFDDEGVCCHSKNVVENGVLKTYLHNLKTAAMMNTKSTGNGFKPGVQASVGVIPSNLYLKAGDVSFADMLKKVKSGVYVNSVAGLHAGLNPISGSFNLQSSGYLIENGKLGKPVTLIILSGTLQEMLNNVSYVGSDFEFKRGVGAPSIAIKSMAISGK